MPTLPLCRFVLRAVFGVSLALLLGGCFPSSDPNARALGAGGSAGDGAAAAGMDANTSGTGAVSGETQSDGGASVALGKCSPVSAEPLPQRSAILSVTVQPSEHEVLVNDVYHQFEVLCKTCHIDQALGNFKVTPSDYLGTLRNPKILQRLTSDDLTQAMPAPATVPYSQRPEGDPVRKLVKELTEWAAAKYPPDLFLEKLETMSVSPYALSTDTGLAFTNLGTCLPAAKFPFASDEETMTALDAAFAARKRATAGEPADRIGLPTQLSDTDLTSLDSEVLARRGVVAFAPAYPLWSDDAGKQRYVRVPLGKSIVFNRQTQHFEIPNNTRFYKTFMKKVKDRTGEERWRKLETRLIVARADITMTSDPNYVPQSLYGSYRWDETETHADLETDQLRDLEPFRDDLFEYVEDEPAALAIRAKKPANLTYELEYAKVVRHWAIPGSKRCIHCHEGSSNGDFILGFTPLQINRRPLGEGGIYEAPESDELTQLQRLIDLGVITGISSADEIVKLEDSQGSRKPRNEQELKAQAYLLANCAHCHNPNGFPSVANQELVSALNFYPSDVGGVFQFSLENYSPRITRSYDSSKIAYITPSMRDIIPPTNYSEEEYPYKYGAVDPNSPAGLPYFNAPWRSLIYRNVHTAFTYSDALTLYPHMPFDTGGHDCRAGQWLGEWMVSIPAERKHPEIPENSVKPEDEQDTDPQPYREVLPGTPNYDKAVADAKARLAVFRNDPRYQLCPDNSDLVDPLVASGRYPYPRDSNGDGVPDHPNWVVTDLTENPGLWTPRRGDWASILASDPPKLPSGAGLNDTDLKALEAQKVVVDLLGSAHLSDVLPFANTEFPMALWQSKPGCKFDSIPKASSFVGSARPAWFDVAAVKPDAPVYSVLPGQAIFDMICINCHGPNADSLGRQADTLQNLTGGAARVANFRYGLFNPELLDDPYDKPDLGKQSNRNRVFGSVATPGISVDDWGARYLAWMALGGTGVKIPPVILQQVARTDVAGQARPRSLTSLGSLTANMLQVAQAACTVVLAEGRPFRLDDVRRPDRNSTPLILSNGDAELWSTVCNLQNSLHVYKISLDGLHFDGSHAIVDARFFPATLCDANGLPAGCFPSDAPVGDARGNVLSALSADNTFPWCLNTTSTTSTPIELAALQTFASQFAVNGKPLPICPSSWLSQEDLDARARWIAKGAINAGFTVFTFLNQFIQEGTPHLAYDQCDKLTQ